MSNDASASSFGWNFQANAAIILLIKCIKNAESIKVESKNQDIEIKQIDGSFIYAQAKSVVAPHDTANISARLKDALVSLSSVPINCSKLVYVTNIKTPFNDSERLFQNREICPYAVFSEKDKININAAIASIKEKLEKSIIEEQLKAKKDEHKSCRSNAKLDNINNFKVEDLNVYVVFPYYDADNKSPGDKGRYVEVSEAIQELLDNFKFNSDVDFRIKGRLLEHWQNYFAHNSTLKDGPISKSISKKDFLLPILYFLGNDELEDVESILETKFEPAGKREALNILSNKNFRLEYEGFEFYSKVIGEYDLFVKNCPNTSNKIKEFLNEKWSLFEMDFSTIEEDIVKEIITKKLMYNILLNRIKMNKIKKGANIS